MSNSAASLLTVTCGGDGVRTWLASNNRGSSDSREGMNRFDLQRIAPELTPKCWIRKKSGGTDLFGRLWWDKPGFTIRTEFFKPEKGRYLHPKQHRPITHREAARIQSFPDSYRFMGKKTVVSHKLLQREGKIHRLEYSPSHIQSVQSHRQDQ